jgi:ribosomal-protein-alanine N-acetyltransferase
MLATKHLYLREWHVHDLTALHTLDTDPEIQRYRNDTIIAEEQTREYLDWVTTLAHDSERTHYPFAVILSSSEQVIGACFLQVTNWALREAEVAYSLQRHLWNQGYTTEAAQALVGYGFDTLQLHRIWAKCIAENIGSWRVMEKIGMQREGYLRENRWLHGQWWDILLYAILDHEWYQLHR